jgi:hypothetical protein
MYTASVHIFMTVRIYSFRIPLLSELCHAILRACIFNNAHILAISCRIMYCEHISDSALIPTVFSMSALIFLTVHTFLLYPPHHAINMSLTVHMPFSSQPCFYQCTCAYRIHHLRVHILDSAHVLTVSATSVTISLTVHMSLLTLAIMALTVGSLHSKVRAELMLCLYFFFKFFQLIVVWHCNASLDALLNLILAQV